MKTLIKWTIDEYHHLLETGILSDRQIELLAGDIIEMSPEGPLHYTVAESGADYLKILFTQKAHIRFNGPVTLSNSEPVPDIAVVKLPQEQYRDHHPTASEIYWVVEISKSTLKYDLEEKGRIYAQARIEEYWVVDVNKSQIYVLRYPEEGVYQSVSVVTSDKLIPLSFPEIEILVDRFLLE